MVLDKGHLVGWGTHDELMNSNEIYRTTYQAQQKGGSEDE